MVLFSLLNYTCMIYNFDLILEINEMNISYYISNCPLEIYIYIQNMRVLKCSHCTCLVYFSNRDCRSEMVLICILYMLTCVIRLFHGTWYNIHMFMFYIKSLFQAHNLIVLVLSLKKVRLLITYYLKKKYLFSFYFAIFWSFRQEGLKSFIIKFDYNPVIEKKRNRTLSFLLRVNKVITKFNSL